MSTTLSWFNGHDEQCIPGSSRNHVIGGWKVGLQTGWYKWKDPIIGRVEGVISDGDGGDIMGVISWVFMKTGG
jgi:hypothetical protein